MKETFERNYKYSYRIFSLYKSITEEDRAFIWRIELSTRNRQFPKIAKCPLCANPHRHSQISPLEIIQITNGAKWKSKAEPSSALNRKPQWRHICAPAPFHFVFSPHPPRPSTDTIDTIHPPSQASKLGSPKGRRREPTKGEGRVASRTPTLNLYAV